MAVELENKSNKNYYKFKQGYFYRKTDESNPNYQVKEFETKDGKESYGGVYARKISGMVSSVYIRESEYEGSKFESLNIEFEDGDVITFSVISKAGSSVMSVLPSVDFSKELSLLAWEVEGKTGVTLKQKNDDGEEYKLEHFFYDFETKRPKNGAPEFTGDKNDKDDWKIFFKQQEKFLKSYVKENISPKFVKEVLDSDTLESVFTEEVDPNEIKF